jgi:hypothetical protein
MIQERRLRDRALRMQRLGSCSCTAPRVANSKHVRPVESGSGSHPRIEVYCGKIGFRHENISTWMLRQGNANASFAVTSTWGLT